MNIRTGELLKRVILLEKYVEKLSEAVNLSETDINKIKQDADNEVRVKYPDI
ncbi:MAG: hypothetical protein ISR82_00165 [Candidatus Marinimicrobia bacterium]|nr:hypothetical protein [Candidatus Neomarinimicrobiota bacterium]MBL7009617.1 hypothetical protein [Candidatus Neomarinimicrobiota bacterium]MBL7029640.1 hypothetical protein [Candidatus Neomarinimicrobiota bacterium]